MRTHSHMPWPLVALIALVVGVGLAVAKPSSAPVTVEFTVPPDVKTGDEVTTVLRFRALQDLQQLEVSVAPFMGLELLSDTRDATFRDVRKGTAPEVVVRIRLTDPKSGSLAVTFKTRSASGQAAGAITVEYGDVD
jgi:hypothetical protein